VIFVAVGTQFPFDRLIRHMDDWLKEQTIIEPCFAQIGTGEYEPNLMEWERFIDADAYADKIQQAGLIVSHAGMGSIITAIESQTPIIVINRQHQLGEHRNDHQADGLEWMGKLSGVYTASTQEDLYNLLDQRETLVSDMPANLPQRQSLINYIDQLVYTS